MIQHQNNYINKLMIPIKIQILEFHVIIKKH